MICQTVPVRIGLHPSVRGCLPEVKYVFRTLTQLAGFPVRFVWLEPDARDHYDIYYGPDAGSRDAHVGILAGNLPYSNAVALEPRALLERSGLPFLDFNDGPGGLAVEDGRAFFSNDIIFASYWLLSGAREPAYPRDRWDNLHIHSSFVGSSGILAQPIVSWYAKWLRAHLRAAKGSEPVALPWAEQGAVAAFAFTHDVDYPEIIKWVETLRLLRARGVAAAPSVTALWRGDNHFWKFADWIAFEKEYGARGAFYFMARRGSLAQYALGTPDAFYDIQTPRFRSLFRELTDAGCEIGLHASFHAHKSSVALRREREKLEECAGVSVAGGRHHYWHLDPRAPHETLRRQAEAGLRYDSSLGFEFFPGFRRGVCHPFRPYDPDARRALPMLELPTAWMDDHFDRRTLHNHIQDPDSYARELLATVRATGGVAIVDYHARGMNRDFYPRYGQWLTEFARQNLDASFRYLTPRAIADIYEEYESVLNSRSVDEAQNDGPALSVGGEAGLDVHPMRSTEVAEVAAMHLQLFGSGESHGTSMANLGLAFLEEVFYRLNLDNPSLHFDVARYGQSLVGFSVYSSGGSNVFSRTLRRHFVSVTVALLRAAARRPQVVAKHIIDNLRFLADHSPASLKAVPGWWIVAGVHADVRSVEFKKRTGISVSDELVNRMRATLTARGCDSYWGVTPESNAPMNRFLIKQGGHEVARGVVQGIPCVYYRVPLKRSEV